MVEYVGLNPAQQIYGIKNLLYCEMSLLETIKTYEKYRELKKQSNALRSLLKRTILEMHDELKRLESLLPKTRYDKFKAVDISTEKKKRRDLEEEIAEIKGKIAELTQI